MTVSLTPALVWIATHRLDPYEPIASGQNPVQVEAVSMDWQWLFIYPRLGIATVNQLVFPANTPLSLRLTSDSVMTSFFIPRLGSQIYAMAGMQTRLNLQADKPGRYLGENTQYSGAGFSGMHFAAVAMTRDDFEHWVGGTPFASGAGPDAARAARAVERPRPGRALRLGPVERVADQRRPCLDGAGDLRADPAVLPGAHGHAGPADARPLPRHAFLYQRDERQPNDVPQSVLDLGPSRGLHRHPARLRCVLRGGADLLRQAALWL